MDGFVRGRAGPAEAEQVVVEAEAARPAIGAFRAVALAALLVALALSRTLASLAVAAGAARVAVAGQARTRAPAAPARRSRAAYFSGFMMRSYASLMRFMRSAAAGSFGFRSGWFSRAFLR